MISEEILSKIQGLGKQRGGRIGFRAFLAATGMGSHQLLGKYWATWNEAVTEAGLDTAQFRPPITEEGSVIGPFTNLVERLKKWPAYWPRRQG